MRPARTIVQVVTLALLLTAPASASAQTDSARFSIAVRTDLRTARDAVLKAMVRYDLPIVSVAACDCFIRGGMDEVRSGRFTRAGWRALDAILLVEGDTIRIELVTRVIRMSDVVADGARGFLIEGKPERGPATTSDDRFLFLAADSVAANLRARFSPRPP